jgi:acetoin utilization deacetylase AcuC-like enzyme
LLYLTIHLPDNTTDQTYLNILKDQLPQLIQQVKPDFVFYLSGVDILSTDKLGKLGCTIEGCKERDRFVLSLLHQYQLPVEISMGGGYSKDIKIIINAHANTYRMAQDIYY